MNDEKPFVEKIPDVLRYFLAIPFGIISIIVVYVFLYFIITYTSDPESLHVALFKFAFNNIFYVIIFLYAVNYMMPKYKNEMLIVLTTVLVLIALLGLFYSYNGYIDNDWYILGYIFLIITSIGTTIYLRKENINKEIKLEEDNKE